MFLEEFGEALTVLGLKPDPKDIIGRMFLFGADESHPVSGLITWVGMVDDDGFLSLGTNVDDFRGSGPIRLVYRSDKKGWVLHDQKTFITGTCSLSIIN